MHVILAIIANLCPDALPPALRLPNYDSDDEALLPFTISDRY